MFRSMKLGTKISLGFASLLVLALFLGTLGVVNMNGVKGDSQTLAKEYVPEVDLCNQVERNAFFTMYEMRGYALSEEHQYLEKGQKHLDEVTDYLQQCGALSDRAEHLVKLGPAVAATRKALDSYRDLVDQTAAITNKLADDRKSLDEAAAAYMQNCNDFLASQNASMDSEITSGAGAVTLQERLQKITVVNEIIDIGNATRIACFKSQAARDPELIRNANPNFDAMSTRFDVLRVLTKQSAGQARIDATEQAANTYKKSMNDLLANWLALQTVSEQRTVAGDEVLTQAQNTATAGIEGTHRIAESAANRLAASSTVMLIGLAVCIVLGLAMTILITRSITKPLRRIIEGLTAGSQQTASAAAQVSSASVSLADGASRQAAAIEETSSSVEEMAAMTRQNAENAKRANELASRTKESADRGVASMARMNQAIDDIKQSSDSTARIIKTIDEIAFQTNLLALNAAVEAARAGEAGKGFAVVAEEVRNLAQRSAEAAKNTAEMIEESVHNADNGVVITREVGEALAEIGSAAGEVYALVAGISAASNEQAQGIDQINEAVGQLDHITQSNAANAEESASASEELSSQAEELSSMVRRLETMVGGTDARMSTYLVATPPKVASKAMAARSFTRARPASASAKPVPKSERTVIPLEDDDFANLDLRDEIEV